MPFATESFEPRHKFPPRMKDILVAVAVKANELREYEDDFFALLPEIFPYNLFTLKVSLFSLHLPRAEFWLMSL